jgi:bacterioferritin-associated ferredoxin
MFVCICYAVTQTEVEAEICEGARTEEQIAERCGAGAGCGSCVEKICAILRHTTPNCESLSLAVA